MCSSVLGQVSGGLQPMVSLLGVFIHQEQKPRRKRITTNMYIKK
jgi:hypothetical protein